MDWVFMGVISLLEGGWFLLGLLSGFVLLAGAVFLSFRRVRRDRSSNAASPIQEPLASPMDNAGNSGDVSETSQGGEVVGSFSLAVSLVTSLGLLPVPTDPSVTDAAVNDTSPSSESGHSGSNGGDSDGN